MSKNIVFCADGTWNGPDYDSNGDDLPDTTNVWKLFTNLEGELDPATALIAKEQEKVANGPMPQVAKYLHGVGDSANPIHKILGGAFGAGVIARIVRGYTYISRHYEDGDRIYLVGFSRGAYTVRALAGLIADSGVLDRSRFDLDDKALAYRLGTMAWRSHRQSRIASRAQREGSSLLDRFQAILDDLPRFASGDLGADSYREVSAIRAVAVWDTVGAMGIPVYLDADGHGSYDGRRADVYRFADTDLNPKVEFGFHAVSLDELRRDFEPTLWTARKNVTQILFSGAHADVGGGYTNADSESGLSDCALDWMLRSLTAPNVGLRCRQPLLPMSPDAEGTAHQPWLTSAFVLLPRGPRVSLLQASGLAAHASVRDRRQAVGGVRAAPGIEAAPYVPAVWSDAFTSGQPPWVS